MLDNPVVIILLTIVVLVLIRFGLVLLLCGGDVGRIGLADRGRLRILRDRQFAEKVKELLYPPPPKPSKPSGEPLRLLALLQRDGRLVDFLMTENIQAADTEQIVAAVKELQPKWMEALAKYADLGPVIARAEGETVEVPAGFDPSAIRLTGNVTGQPPFRGTLVHPGWRVTALRVPAPPEGQDEFVLHPAEVELP
ncbi:MAG: DUF2760 domain-containing protein [Gemmataceae bacterium]|nr:DUF2760 domain-containing protein [Gemmataceae bacterium]